MISQLWTNVSLEDYNKWFPLTGTINQVPDKYQTFYADINQWFTAFALRAQNDINAYLDFILYKFPFDAYKDPLVKETLVDMVFVMIEHWVFNRIPIESLTDLTTQFTNGINLNSQSTPTLNIFDLAPSRMKNLAQLTQLKQLIYSYQDQEIDANLIDLGAFYDRMEVDALLKTEQDIRTKGDQDNHQFTLDKQMKLYDDVIKDGNDTEVLRGPITKFINKGYVSTNYDPKTETMTLDWPSEIGTLPPEALQPNPQEGDVTHAPTADFSAKLQKRITTNENNIKNNSTNITDIKNNLWIEGEYKWMPTTITTMPTGWKKVNLETGLTLISGVADQLTDGKVQMHNHSMNAKVAALDINASGNFYNIASTAYTGSGNPHEWIILSEFSELKNITETAYSIGESKNLAAGLQAILWQYDPNNKFNNK